MTLVTLRSMQTLHKYVHSTDIAILNSHNQTDTMSFKKQIKARNILTYVTETTHVVNQQQDNN